MKEQTILLLKPGDVTEYASNILAIMAEANLKEYGKFCCYVGGVKTIFRIGG